MAFNLSISSYDKMVKLKVLISMELEGVTEVQPFDEDFQHYFTVLCTSCREEHPKIVSFNHNDDVEISGSRGSAHFVWRCQNCKKEHSASIIPPTSTTKSLNALPYPQPRPSNQRDNSTFSPFIAIDCRGLEFIKYHFRGKWKCKGEESGTAFEFDLDENDGEDEGRWDDYDEKAEAPVGVSDLQAKIERM